MFLFCVFNFVVADAVEALDEHHHGGNPGGGDFGGVVEGAGREAMDLAAGFADGFVAERDEFFVERARGDLPKAFPGDFYVALGANFSLAALADSSIFASARASR
jgi:hypothetical protein